MKVKQMFKQKMFRQPTGCIPWQHTPEVLCGKWLNLEVTVGVAVSASKCSRILSAQDDHSHGANAYHFQRDWPTVAPHDGSVWFASPLRAIFERLATGSEALPGTTLRQLNLFSMMMLDTSLDRKPNAINEPQCKIWRTWPCSFNTSSATFPVQWDSSFCGRMVEKYWRWRHPSASV